MCGVCEDMGWASDSCPGVEAAKDRVRRMAVAVREAVGLWGLAETATKGTAGYDWLCAGLLRAMEDPDAR